MTDRYILLADWSKIVNLNKRLGEPLPLMCYSPSPGFHTTNGFTIQRYTQPIKGVVSRLTQLNKVMVAPKWGRITDSHLLKLHLEHFTQI